MVAPATATRKKKTRAWEEEECPHCGRCRRAREESIFLGLAPPPLPALPTRFSFSSTVTSPVTHDLTAAYATHDLSSAFGLLNPILSPDCDFTLQVTAQAVPLPRPVCDPPLVLRLCFGRRWLQRRRPPDSSPAQGSSFASTEPTGSDQVSRSTMAFVGHFQSSAERFMCADSALADVRNLLASAPGCGSDPWASMPVPLFTADAAARIYKFLKGCRRAGSLGPDRFVCHLDVTAHCASLGRAGYSGKLIPPGDLFKLEW